MTLTVPPPRVELIAPNAPFTPEQRDWLNGFFAGLLALENSGRHRAFTRAIRRADAGCAGRSRR